MPVPMQKRHPLLEDQAQNGGARCSQSHAHADLTLAAAHGVGEDPIQPHAGQRQGKESNDLQHAQDHARIPQHLVHYLRACADVGDLNFGINIPNLALHRFKNKRWIARRAYIEDGCASGILAHRQIQAGLWGFAQGSVVAGLHHADDLARDGIAGETKVLANRVAVGPVAPRKILVDDDDGKRSVLIRIGQGAALQERNAHGFKVADVDRVGDGADGLRLPFLLLSLNEDAARMGWTRMACPRPS